MSCFVQVFKPSLVLSTTDVLDDVTNNEAQLVLHDKFNRLDRKTLVMRPTYLCFKALH